MRDIRTKPVSGMFGALLIAVTAATAAAALTFASGGGFLLAAAVYCVTGSALVAGWAGMVVVADRRPRLRAVRVAILGHRGVA